jgi:hypothetical protein
LDIDYGKMQSTIFVISHISFYLRSWRGALDTTLCYTVCQWLASGRWFSPGIPVSSTNENDNQGITEILLKVALNTITRILTNVFDRLSCLSRGLDETVPDNTIYITNIYVLDKFRNRGIGEQLLLKAENEAKMRDISVCKFYFLKLKTRPLMKMTIRYIGTA